MTVSTQIRKSEDNFKLAQAICKLVAEKYEKTEEEVWEVLSPNYPVSKIQKRFKKHKKANDPLSSVKKPRTAYSFFTKDKRQDMAKKNPDVSFGDLSRLVSAEWKKLSESQLTKYKKKEEDDRERYNKEKTKVLAELERNPPAPVQAEEPADEAEPVVKKTTPKNKGGKGKAKVTVEAEVTVEKTVTKGKKSTGKGKGGNKKAQAAAVTA